MNVNRPSFPNIPNFRPLSGSLLPLADSPDIILDQSSEAELHQCWLQSYLEWGDERPPNFHMAKEDHLCNQSLTANGGITHWVLIDNGRPIPNSPTVLASCDTIKKRAFIACRAENGAVDVKEVVTHCIYGVFCRKEYRNRGYASRMIEEMRKKLETRAQPEGSQTLFILLYSDIGKVCSLKNKLLRRKVLNDLHQKFYERHGFKAHSSTSLSLLAAPQYSVDVALTESPMEIIVASLTAADLPICCQRDEELLKEQLLQHQSSDNNSKRAMALVPDLPTLQWHHAGEEIFARTFDKRKPDIKGAMATTVAAKVWCVWVRDYDKQVERNVLHILRLVIEDCAQRYNTELTTRVQDNGIKIGIQAVLLEAQKEAAKCGLHHVEIWNPPEVVVQAAKVLDSEVRVADRDYGISCLMCYDGFGDSGEVEWIANEKYGSWF